MVCDTARTRSSGILTVVGNSVPHVAVANPPPFPDGGNDTPRREEKVRYRGGGRRGVTFRKFQGLYQYRVRIFPYPGGRIRTF